MNPINRKKRSSPFAGLSVALMCGAMSAMTATFCETTRGQEESIASLSLSTASKFERPRMVGLDSLANANIAGSKTIADKPFFLESDRFCHRRLLFEEPGLEREGECQRFQVLRSGSLFLVRAIVLPLTVFKGEADPCECPQREKF